MITRSLEQAKEAFKKGDVVATVTAHNSTEQHKSSGQYIKSAVYGGLDGTITTFAVVAGVAGASLKTGIVLILGFANLIADGLSMAIGDYLSTKAEIEYQKAERKREEWEVDNYPEGEKKEMIELYADKGMPRKDAKKMVDMLSKNKKAWVDVMMVEELGIINSGESPIKNAFVTFSAFAIFGFIPLISYILVHITKIKINSFYIAALLTALTLFMLGSLKVKFTGRNWFKSGFEMLLIGGVTASVAYFVGYILSGLA